MRVDRVFTVLTFVGVPSGKLHQADIVRLSLIAVGRARAGLIPINSAPPTITGTARQTQTLTAADGTWTNRPASYAVQWQRCDNTGANCVAIARAAGQSYVVAAADIGATLRVSVTASNALGTSQPATSSVTPTVT
jgi:hypothetical protein